MVTEAPSVKKIRPVNLNLFTISFPIPAIVSILHRLSGLLLFVFVPLVVWVLQNSLSSPDGFASVQTLFAHKSVKFFIWFFLSGLIYHMMAGIRHFIMNFGWLESLRAMRFTAKMVLILSIVLSLGLGIWLW
ncbi:MAG TPA: succinate dehydrogenase, cytochrome b556 subunit [Gammaproteobacteria bacterium]|nr:succinate dehydrogenase, cytochrome b556 subunit [Gammaproteobacteria bacterium]